LAERRFGWSAFPDLLASAGPLVQQPASFGWSAFPDLLA